MRSTSKDTKVNQSYLHQKMAVFLHGMGEELPDWSNKGLCNAYVLMRIRARMIGEDKKYDSHLRILSRADNKLLLQMGDLLRQYKSVLNYREAELREKLKLVTDEKQENTIRKKHQDEIIKQVAVHNGKFEPFYAELIKDAEDAHYFINNLLAAFAPNYYFGYLVETVEMKENKEITTQRPIQQSDYLDILRLVPPDALIHHTVDEKDEKKTQTSVDLPIRKAFEFSFNFTEQELAKTFETILRDDDYVRIVSTDHVMFITKRGDKYYLEDPNSAKGEEEYKSCAELAAKTKEYFFKGCDQTWLPIGMDIYEKATGEMTPRPAADALLKTLLDGRGDKKNIDAKAWDGTTSLVQAVTENHIETVRALLAQGADPTIPNNKGMTPLYVAASLGHAAMTKLLLEALAKRPEKPADEKDEKKQDKKSDKKPILVAAHFGHVEVLKELASHLTSKEMLATDSDGWSAIHYAAIEGRPDFLQEFRQYTSPEDWVRPDKKGRTPLFLAAEQGDPKVIEMILEEIKKIPKTTDSNEASQGKYSPLRVAVEFNHYAACKKLLDYGVNPNEIATEGQYKGKSIGVIARKMGNKSAMVALLEHGASFPFVKKKPKLAIQVLLEVQNVRAVHPEVIKEINAHRGKLITAFVELLATIYDPAKQKKLIDETLKGENLLGSVLNVEQLGMFGSLFRPASKQHQGKPVTQDMYKLLKEADKVVASNQTEFKFKS
jgi:ankyrin repeat protein